MADVARHAGVSMITVSRLLREPERVADATRLKIEKAIEEVGYVPNLVAGGLASTQTSIVAAVLPYFQQGSFEMVRGLSDKFSRNSYCLLMGNSDGKSAEEDDIARVLLGYRPAGLVIQGASHTGVATNLLHKANIPVVEMDSLPKHPIDMCVGYSNKHAAKTAVQYLIGLGRRRIGILVANPQDEFRRARGLGGYLDRHALRLLGYQEALEEAGIPYDPKLVMPANFSVADGRRAFVQMLEANAKFDALFCAHDIWAVGTIYECQRRGIKVPDQLAICGFGDLEFAAEIIPSITTIQLPRYEIGTVAAEMIITRLKGEIVEQPVVDLGFTLIERMSA
jgi:LacI family gluconate utilization system Gnt-I transcriptional repressor